MLRTEKQPPLLATVRLTNVRGFERLNLNMERTINAGKPYGRSAVVIGRNGTNKSTLLRSIAIGAGSHGDASAMLSAPLGSLIGRASPYAVIELTYVHPDGTRVTATKAIGRSPRGYDEVIDAEGPTADELGLLVCGYGAGRGVTATESGISSRPYDAVATLFDYRRELLAPELTLRRLLDFIGDDDRYRATLAKITRAIGLTDAQAEIVANKGGGLSISGRDIGEDVPLEGLADGYRVAFNWIMDLYGRGLQSGWIAPEGSVAALVLVDEIEQHLHPELQTRIVVELSRAFPDSQFLLTTHSPLVALGSDPSQLLVLHRDDYGRVRAADRVPDYRAYSPDEILVDDRLFDVEARNPEFAGMLHQYEELASRPPEERSERETDSLRQVARMIRTRQQPGYSASELERATAEIESSLPRDDFR